MFEYSKFDVYHPDYPEQKITGLEAMCKRGAELKGFAILIRQHLIPLDTDKRRMQAQEI